MSLIAEALRKAGQTPELSLPNPPPPRNNFRWMYGALLIGCAAGVLALSLRWAPPGKVGSLAAKAQEKTSSILQRPTSGMSLLRIAESQWRLNGIVAGGPGKPLALINNKLVEEGGSVGNARVIRVAKDEVDLEESGGQVKTLKLR